MSNQKWDRAIRGMADELSKPFNPSRSFVESVLKKWIVPTLDAVDEMLAPHLSLSDSGERSRKLQKERDKWLTK